MIPIFEPVFLGNEKRFLKPKTREVSVPVDNVEEKTNVDVIEKYKMKSFIRISADSPLIDSKIIDNIIKIFSSNKYDIVTNVFPRSFPKGLSVEAIKTKVFFKNFKNIQKKKEFREHVSMYFYKNSNNFKIYNLKNNKNLSHVNLSVDNINDLNFIRYIFRKKLNKLKWNEILVKLNLI